MTNVGANRYRELRLTVYEHMRTVIGVDRKFEDEAERRVTRKERPVWCGPVAALVASERTGK
jgi:hypothetical protein